MIAQHERGVYLKDRSIVKILEPGIYRIFDLLGRMDVMPREIVNYVYTCEVADNHIGLLIVDGELLQKLQPGLYAYWKFNRKVKVEQVELRLQVMEVQGQEILTKDKVSLRINLSAHYQITDPLIARSKLVNITDYVYRELQFALRQVVGVRTLDSLLGNKDEMDGVIFGLVREKISEFGIEVHNVGVKDVLKDTVRIKVNAD